jgi:hypothetical protein
MSTKINIPADAENVPMTMKLRPRKSLNGNVLSDISNKAVTDNVLEDKLLENNLDKGIEKVSKKRV